MTTQIVFERGGVLQPYWYTFWPRGEMKTFQDREAAEAYAQRQALQPVFIDGDGHAEIQGAD